MSDPIRRRIVQHYGIQDAIRDLFRLAPPMGDPDKVVAVTFPKVRVVDKTKPDDEGVVVENYRIEKPR